MRGKSITFVDMTQQDVNKVQSILDELYLNRVVVKSSDNQLVHYEKLASWRNSPENRVKNRDTALKSSPFTMEEVKQIRDEFYYGIPTTIGDLNKRWGSRVADGGISRMLENKSYYIEDWTYPDFNERKKLYSEYRDQKYAEDILKGIGSTNFMEKWGVSYVVYSRICKKIGYKSKRHGRRRPNV